MRGAELIIIINIKSQDLTQQMYNQENPYPPFGQQNNYPPPGYPQPGPASPYSQPNQFGDIENPANYRGIIQGGRQQSHKLSEEEYYAGESSLSDNARKGFIGKLLITAAIGYIGYNSPGFRETFGKPAVFITITVLLVSLSCVIGCCTDFFRRFALPIFILFTVLLSILVAIGIAGYQSSVVLLAVVVTLVVVIALTIYACFTKTDFTGAGPYLLVFSLVLCCFGISLIFWKNSVAQLVYACLGALLFSIYLIYDTQLILGKGEYSYSLDDAYLAAIQLYLDIINLFLFILRILGSR